MELSEVKQFDMLTNLYIKSKTDEDTTMMLYDHKLNYHKTYDNPK